MKRRLFLMFLLMSVIFLGVACNPVIEHTLTVTVEGCGKVSPDKGIFKKGDIITFEMQVEDGWVFSGWRENGCVDLVKKEGLWNLLINEDIKVTAIFKKEEYEIDLSIVGGGRVVRELIAYSENGLGVNIISLVAIPDSGWEFKEWIGDIASVEQEIKITLDGSKNIEAVFEKLKYGLLRGNVKLEFNWPAPKRPVNLWSSVGPFNKSVGKQPIIDYATRITNFKGKAEFVPGQLIVGFKQNILLPEEELEILNDLGLKILMELSAIHCYLVKVPTVADSLSIQSEMTGLFYKISAVTEHVAYVEPNYYAYPLSNHNYPVYPDDPEFVRQWNLMQVRLPQAWQATTGSKSVRIGVIDIDFDPLHPDLIGNIDFSSAKFKLPKKPINPDPTVTVGHGTLVAGVLGAKGNNGLGISGAMWEVSLIPIDPSCFSGYLFDCASHFSKALLYAAGIGEDSMTNPVDIINISGGYPYTQSSLAAINAVANKGILIFAGAGNCPSSPILSPANHPYVICVGATDYNYPNAPNRASYSSIGPEMELVAPGGLMIANTGYGWPYYGADYCDGVYSTSIRAGGYEYRNGTSLSTPLVAGIAGLMLANDIPAYKVRDILRRTAIDLGPEGFDNEFGYGLVNAYWAVNNVLVMHIAIGQSDRKNIIAVDSITLDQYANPAKRNYCLYDIPKGSYKVFAWIDVEGDGIGVGDHYYESDYIYFNGDDKYLDITLEEIMSASIF